MSKTLLHEVLDKDDGVIGQSFWCEPCGHMHVMWTKHHPISYPPTKPDGKTPSPLWTWNWSKKLPTFTPSLISRVEWPDGKKSVCHLILTDGVIQYQGDCTHGLAGKSVPLTPF